jgi:hypothetical protein
VSRVHSNPANLESAGDGESPIRLSIAVAAPGIGVPRLERFIASFGRLDERDEVRIAVAPAQGQRGNFERWLAATRLDPGVAVELHPTSTSPMRLWGSAMADARGRHVAVLDARDAPSPGWLLSWSAASQSDETAIVWGPVAPGNLEDHCSWAAYLAEYGQFWSVEKAANTSELPGNNLVLPRAALPSAETLRADGFWKTFHLGALRASAQTSGATRPQKISLSPDMLVRVERRYRVGDYLRRRYTHGRCYGGRRLQQPDAPMRILCLGFSPLLPLLRIARVLSRLGSPSERTTSQSRWPRAALLPLILGEVAWSWGEFAGYARGPGNACEELA